MKALQSLFSCPWNPTVGGHMTRRTLVCVGVLLAIIGAVEAQERRADLVLSNGKIITVDERFTIAQAVAITGDRIVAVGTNQEIGAAGGTEHQTDRPDGTGRHARTHRQPHASAARREHLVAGAPLRRRRVAQESDRDAARPGESGGAGRMGLQHRRLGPSAVRRRSQTLHARRAGSDRAGQSGRAAGVVLPGLPEQQGAVGVWNRSGQARPDRLHQRIDSARRRRKTDRRHQRRHRRDAPVCRQDAQTPAGPARGEHHGPRQRHESRRPDVGRRPRLQRRRARDLSEMEGAGPVAGSNVLHRRRRGRHARRRWTGPSRRSRR